MAFTVLQYILLFILLIIGISIKPLISYRPFFQWWNANVPEDMNGCFSLIDLAYYQYAYPLYVLRKFFRQSGTGLIENTAWIYFLTGFLYSGSITSDGGYTNVITPKNFCKTIAPDGGSPCIINGKESANTYPLWDGFNSEDWKNQICTWLKVDRSHFDRSNPESVKSSDNGNTWRSDPTNFLWQVYSFPPDSPAIIGFITGWNGDFNNMNLYAQDLQVMLGTHQGVSAGGLFGFCQVAGPNIAQDEIFQRLYQNDTPSQFSKAASNPPKHCDVLGSVNSAFNGAIGGLMAGGMFVEGGLAAATGPVAFGIAALTLITGGLSGAAEAKRSGCF